MIANNYNDTNALRNKKQLRIDQTGTTGVNPVHTHGLGLWGNPRVVMSVRVDKELKKQFNLASQALFGSTCNPVEVFMASIIGTYKNQELLRVNPSRTEISIGEIKIERNLRERRKVAYEDAKEGKVEGKSFNLCQIGDCDNEAEEVWVYQPKGQQPIEKQICSKHASGFAGTSCWRVKL